MKLAIMQPYFMPYIGYFQAIAAVDKYILYGNLTFIKDAWMNRNRLKQKNGNVLLISVPLSKKSSNTLIHDVLVDNNQPWVRKLLKTIKVNYQGAEYFDEVYELLSSILEKKYETLCELNCESIIKIAQFLEIDTQIEYKDADFIDMEAKLTRFEETGDYAEFPYLTKTRPIKKVARAIEMCKIEQSDFFVNAIGGQALYDKNEFAQYGIDLNFIETNTIVYPQFKEPFEPNLSIIDVLMHNGKEGTQRLLKEYRFV